MEGTKVKDTDGESTLALDRNRKETTKDGFRERERWRIVESFKEELFKRNSREW